MLSTAWGTHFEMSIVFGSGGLRLGVEENDCSTWRPLEDSDGKRSLINEHGKVVVARACGLACSLVNRSASVKVAGKWAGTGRVAWRQQSLLPIGYGQPGLRDTCDPRADERRRDRNLWEARKGRVLTGVSA
jgi:hypothetical protein